MFFSKCSFRFDAVYTFLSLRLNYDFVASGSLLGLECGEDSDKNVEVPESIPVGYESSLTMYSLDFEEFF